MRDGVGDAVAERRLVLPFNASTGLTMLIGGGTGWTEYVTLTWMATAGACIAGPLGTGVDSEESVRQVAYSQLEAERRRQRRERSRT